MHSTPWRSKRLRSKITFLGKNNIMAMEDGIIIISNEHLIRFMKSTALRWRLVLSTGMLFALIAMIVLTFQVEKYVYSAVLRPSEISLGDSEKQKLLDSKILILEKLRG